jgi:hypothetical protein
MNLRRRVLSTKRALSKFKGWAPFALFLAVIFAVTLLGPFHGWKLWLGIAASVPLSIWIVNAMLKADDAYRNQ